MATLIEAGMTAHEAIEALGFVIVGANDQGETIHCCGEPVSAGSGIFGTDVLRCETCGARMVMFTSPHINGGLVFTDEVYAQIGDREWHLRAMPGPSFDDG